MKCVLFTDLHLGKHSNSSVFNQECLDFMDFMSNWCEQNIHEDYEVYFLGDWYNDRNSINVKTLKYGEEALVKLSNMGNMQYMLLGNHDLFYKNSRDVTSVIIPKDADGIEVIAEPIYLEDTGILLCPWLMNDESLKDLIKEHNPKYVFGHFELPSFKLNQKITMPGEFNPWDYTGPDKIFSGHYHCFSEKANIIYIGNCFSHDFSDSNDWNNKGFIVLDTDTGEYTRVVWDKAPKYLVTQTSDLSNTPLVNNLHLRIINNSDFDEEQIAKLRQGLESDENIVECQILPKELNLDGDIESIEMNDIGNMNTIIPEMLGKVDMENIDSSKLINIYNSLEV